MMPVVPDEPPAQSVEVVNRGVVAAMRGEVRLSDDLGGSGEPELAAAHETYVLGIDAIADGAGIEAATPTGWRYVVARGDDVLGIGETSTPWASRSETSRIPSRWLDSQTNQVLFTKLDTPARARLLVDALQRVEEIAPSDEEFSLRYLRIPALYVSALWLHGAHQDLVLAIDQGGRAAVERELVPADTFLGWLEEAAQRKLAAYSESDDADLGG